MEHMENSVKSEVDLESDSEPKLEIAEDHHHLHHDHHPQHHVGGLNNHMNNTDAVESLLMLGRQPVVSTERQRAASTSSMTVSEAEARSLLRRHSSGSSDASSVRSSDNKVVTYYQRMRERNNEASKRCRLKRRMKAVSMENQSSMLSMANKMLKLRIMRLENVGAALKEGVKKIQAGHCDCDLTINLVRQMSRDYMDKDPMNGKILPSFELISKSKAIRDQSTVQEQNIEMSSSPGLSPTPMMIPSTHAHMASSSEDDIAASPPVENIMPPQPIMLLPKPPSSRVYKTALDVINETIVKTLDSPHPESNPSAALNLVKQQQSAQQQPKQLILVAPSPRPSIESIVSSNGDHHGGSRHSHSARSSPALTTSSSATSSLIKLEHPEVDSSTNNTSSSSMTTTTTTTILHQNSSSNTNFRSSAADELPVCIANPDGASMCRGDMLNLNKLTCYLDLITRKVVKDDGASAMERAIIKSRMKIPFWSADETALVICGAHRNSIVHGVDLNVCALCNKKRNGKKPRLAPIHMFTITYRMSLEYYTRNGIILPIGLAVCGLCRDKHLRSVDLSNSRIIPSISPAEIIVPDSNTSPVSVLPTKRELSTSPNSPELLSLNTNNACPAASAPLPKMRQLSTSSSKVTSTNGDVQVQLVAMSPPQDRIKLDSIKSVVPVSSSQTNAGANIFSKIANLNEALQAINPRYQPIGFSITSMESCSPSVLQDAVSAAETAVFTIMSVIAPGQENHLWEAIRPNLDKKLCKK